MKINFKYLPLLVIIILASILRLYLITDYPAGLNADEASLGYNAYSLLETGKDEHGSWWPLAFRSFDDYKPPLYVYLVLPFIKFLGLTVFAVRLPSALLGIASIILIYFFSNELFPQKLKLRTGNWELGTGEIAGFLLAISPWHLHFSRGAWEVNIATFFLLLGLYAFLKALKQQTWYFLAGFSLVSTLYAYHSMRLIAPLLTLITLVLYWPEFTQTLPKSSRYLISTVIICSLISIPLVIQTFGGATGSRFSGVSIFADQGPLWQALEMRNQHPAGLITKILHNRYLSYSLRFTQNYLSHFSPRFIFLLGDEIARSKVPDIAQSYLFLFPFVFLGLLKLFHHWGRGEKLILSWLLLAPIPAALTFQSPHALRAQNMVIPLTIITALGVYFLLQQAKKVLPLVLTIFLLVSGYNLANYLHLYYDHYPQELPYAWQYGFEELATYLRPKLDQYDQIIISDRYDQPYILLAFFLKYDPAKLQNELIFSDRDNFGFSTGRAFGNFKFHRINWDKDSQNQNSLVVIADEPIPNNANMIHTIYYPNKQAAFRIYQTD